MDVENHITPSTAPRRPRQKEKARSPGADATARYRHRQRAKGIPTGKEIDSVLAETVFKLLLVGRFSLTAEKLSKILRSACRNGGWDVGNKAVQKAIADRVRTLIARVREGEDAPARDVQSVATAS